MAENVRRPLLLLLGLLILALPLSVSAQIAETQNRRILDISLITYKDNYRIKIRLEKPMQAVISDPREGEPLRVQFRGARIEPGFQPKPASNQLISRVWMDSSDAGLASLEFQLATHQVSVTHFSLTTPEPMLIIDLKLKSGAEIPPASSPKNENTPAIPKVTAAGSPAPISELPTTHPPLTSPAIPNTPAVPNADTKPGFYIPSDSEDETETEPVSEEPTPASHIMTPALPVSDLADIAIPPFSAIPPPAVPQATPKPVQPMKPASDEYDYFPLDELHLTFPGANEMLKEYKSNRFMAALKIGFPALMVAQPAKSSVSLLYLLAECRYQLEKGNASPAQGRGGDWSTALNFYQQAKRYDLTFPLVPFADYRIGQIYGRMGQYAEQEAVLSELIRRNLLPNIPQLLMDAGNAALAQYSLAFGKLPRESPIMQQYLKNAENAFRLFLGRFPQSTHFPEAKFLIGEIQYQKRDYARAYQSMFEAYKISKGLDVLPEYLAHFALVAHYQKQVDLVHPESSGNARRFAEFIRSSTNPTLRLEFARLLDQAGAAAQAMSQYDAVAEMIDPAPTAAQRFEARHRITEFALEDLKKGKVNLKIPYDDYLEPVTALDDLTSQTYDIKQIGQLVKQKVETLLAQKKPLDAVRVVLGNPAGQVPNDVAASLRPIVWDVLKEAIPYCRAQNNPLYALEVYDAFASYLEDHPQKNRILLSCAELLMDSDYRADAQRLMDRVTSTTASTMTPEDESELSLLRREAELDSADKEAFKKDAPALTSAGNPIPIRARVFRQLAAIYSDEGNHSKAAQIYLEAANLGEEFPWEERQNFYLLAGKEYEEEDSLLEANRTYLQAMKAFEQEAINIAKGESYLGESLFRMGKNYQQLADYDEAARAFSQYLQLYNQSPNAAPALYLLAQSYEKRNRLTDARDAYELLAKQASDQPFWANAAQKSLNQLKWEESHADLLKGASK